MKKIIAIFFLLGSFFSFGQSGVVTAKGSAADKTTATTLTVSSVTINANCWVVVGCVYSAVFTSITWNGNTCTADLTNTGSNPSTRIHSFYSASGGTGNVVATFSGTISYKAITVYQIANGVNPTALDKTSATGTLSTTSPSTGPTGTTVQADEVAVCVIGQNGPSGDTPGSWSNSFTDDGQRTGTTGGSATTNVTITGAWLVLSATQTVTGAKTSLGTARDCNDLLVTYKCTPPSNVPAPQLMMLGVGGEASFSSLNKKKYETIISAGCNSHIDFTFLLPKGESSIAKTAAHIAATEQVFELWNRSEINFIERCAGIVSEEKRRQRQRANKQC